MMRSVKYTACIVFINILIDCNVFISILIDCIVFINTFYQYKISMYKSIQNIISYISVLKILISSIFRAIKRWVPVRWKCSACFTLVYIHVMLSINNCERKWKSLLIFLFHSTSNYNIISKYNFFFKSWQIYLHFVKINKYASQGYTCFILFILTYLLVHLKVAETADWI